MGQFWHKYPSQTSVDNSKSPDSAVDIENGYGPDDQKVGIQVLVGARIVTTPYRPERFWGPPSLLSNAGILADEYM
jgi:hypothetical protein